MRQSYRKAGFTISALLHAAVAAAFIPWLGRGVTDAEETSVSLQLAMFREAAPARVSEPVEETPATEPEDSTPDEISPQENSEEPAETVVDEVKPEPVPDKASIPEPEPQVVAKPPPTRKITRPRTEKRPARAKPETRVRTETMSETTAAPSAADRQAVLAAESARQRYLSALAGRLHRKKHYPPRARINREEGQVVVSFVIEKSGLISNVRVTRSSGSSLLDKAAVKTVQDISPFREIPDELGVTRWEIAVPIAFSLKS